MLEMFFSQAEKNQKAWALGEKATEGLSHGERGRRNSLRSNTASLSLSPVASLLPFHRRPPCGYACVLFVTGVFAVVPIWRIYVLRI